jgi:long-chain acyl-CoA synthetase
MPQETTPGAYPYDRSGLVRCAAGTLWYTGLRETYTEVLRDTVALRDRALAIVDWNGESLTYAELWDRATRVAGGLRTAGVKRGDRVAIDLPNSLEWVLAFLGAVLAGAVGVPIDPRTHARAREAILKDADPRVVVDTSAVLPAGMPFFDGNAVGGDLAQMLYTSGTTGEPKGVMISQRSLASFGEIARRIFDVDVDGDEPLRNLIVIPLCHAAGCNAQLLPTLALGGTVLLARSPSTPDIVDTAMRFQPDTLLAVPTIYKLLLERERHALRRMTSLRRLVYGAAPTAPGLIEDLHETLPAAKLSNAYGMTEISSFAMLLPPELALSHHDSIGFPVPGVEAEIRDQNAQGLGELYLRGPNMALGYWRKPDLTEETFGTGWVRSGDIAVSRQDGLIWIRDRVKDIINRGGEKVYTLEVENALVSHPDVDEAAVVAVPDDVMGEKVGAVVVVRDGSTVTVEQLTRHVAAHVPKYAVPERIVLQHSPLPRGGSGKILKTQLRRDLLSKC